MSAVEPYRAKHKIRIVSAAALFDGHDAAINVMRRILQASGAEVIHLGHNRAAEEVVDAAIQEDAQAVAITSYQGGHVEFFKYVCDLLRAKGAPHIKVFGGGGGVIVPGEIRELEAYGVAKIFSPEDGRRLGLQGMINYLMQASDFSTLDAAPLDGATIEWRKPPLVARALTMCEGAGAGLEAMAAAAAKPGRAKGSGGGGNGAGRLDGLRFVFPVDRAVPVVGITGTGGAGKSSLTDELVRRFLIDFPESTVAVLAVDPSKRKSGGALLGDRIRMNSLRTPRAYMRSFATRGSGSELTGAISDALRVARGSGYDLIFVETSGIGQGDAAIVDIADISLYVMTAEFGAPTQLEKIDMIDLADMIVINKFERRGGDDALRDVRKQYRRGRNLFGSEPSDEALPVFPTIASHFHDPGVNALYTALLSRLRELGHPDLHPGPLWSPRFRGDWKHTIVPPERLRYLGEIAAAMRGYRALTEQQVEIARRRQHLARSAALVASGGAAAGAAATAAAAELERLRSEAEAQLDGRARALLDSWPAMRAEYSSSEFVYRVREREVHTPLRLTTLSGTALPKVALPRTTDDGEILRYLMLENLPGQFPYTGGVFPFRRQDEDPIRMFAGEGSPERTNRRFHYLCQGHKAKRLSTAFDSVTLYGNDPDERPDIYGKVGESGVSICTLDDMKALYAGFDLLDPNTSVSMTINGPAPIILAFFFNTAIDQHVERFTAETGREPAPDERAEIVERTLRYVRGTVQADILKEDQAQNTCIFSIEFALKMMGDVQQFFVEHGVRNYYSISISGYHIAEAGANPITQLALTLANGFTYVEYFLARGMSIDNFAPNLSFFFSNGLDAEYAVLGRVARRIWAVAMRDRYGAGPRAQQLKYHVQTSGRSLHAQEVQFNDIRTTLQALIAYNDNCNSLHTNAYDEAITTPTEESVRRAMAIQMIIAREFGVGKNENPNQGSYLFEELTDLVEEAVLTEFERLNERGGVLGAMETQYQRSKIQEESLHYERLKHSGELPIVGVNIFLNPDSARQGEIEVPALTRSSAEEKNRQIARLRAFQERHEAAAREALGRLRQVAAERGNVFAELLNTTRVASLGQITKALYEVGGEYRRAM
jgi:methylmalonyl-CoA mutase